MLLQLWLSIHVVIIVLSRWIPELHSTSGRLLTRSNISIILLSVRKTCSGLRGYEAKEVHPILRFGPMRLYSCSCPWWLLLKLLVHFDTGFVGLLGIVGIHMRRLFLLVLMIVNNIGWCSVVIVVDGTCGLESLRLRTCLKKLLALGCIVSDLAAKVKVKTSLA